MATCTLRNKASNVPWPGYLGAGIKGKHDSTTKVKTLEGGNIPCEFWNPINIQGTMYIGKRIHASKLGSSMKNVSMGALGLRLLLFVLRGRLLYFIRRLYQSHIYNPPWGTGCLGGITACRVKFNQKGEHNDVVEPSFHFLLEYKVQTTFMVVHHMLSNMSHLLVAPCKDGTFSNWSYAIICHKWC